MDRDNMNKKEDFKPYVPAEQAPPELTVTSVVTGILLAVVFGAANAYLGLRVGMTVSASIPAAVVSMGVLRILLRRKSVLESNMVQTIGSAGESLAAGAIFTMPVFFLWAKEDAANRPGMLSISLTALLGGLLGVLFMVPLRKALIVKEHGVLPYPEGTACAEVLLAGEKGGTSARAVFAGMGIAALVKFVVDGLKVVPSTITMRIQALRTEFLTEIYPALVGVGYICGAKISSYLFAGGILGWFVLIPLIAAFGGETVLYPGTMPIEQMFIEGGANAIWGSYIRYIGAGAVAAGGIISLVKSLPLIISTFGDAMKGLKGSSMEGEVAAERTALDMNMKVVLGAIVLIILAIALFPDIPVSFLGAFLVAVFGFFFYLIFAQDYHKSKMFRIKEVEDRLRASARQQEGFMKQDLLYLDDPLATDYGDLVRYNLEQAGSVLTLNNEMEIFVDGQEKFADLEKELSLARHFIQKRGFR